MKTTMVNTMNLLLDVPSTDPDDARRRKLLNILLFGLGIIAALALIAIVAVDVAGAEWAGQDRLTAYLGTAAMLVGTLVILAINRYGAGWLASTLLLLLLIAVAAFADEPAEVADGRGLLVFAIPIMMASVILPPYASFIMALLSSFVIVVVKLNLPEGGLPNPFAMLIFFMLAVVSWLAAQAVERALQDLRTLNLELDQRVQDRTRELAESLSRTEAILDSTADGIIVFDTDHKAIVANPATTTLLGRPAETITGLDIETLMSDNVDTEEQETVIDLLESGVIQRSGLKVGWGKRTFSVSMAPVRDNYDQTTGTVAVFRDFTHEAEIDRMKSTFVSIASHELRTPLNAIMGYTEMLQEGIYGELSDKQRGATERLLANTGHMLSLVNNLLDRARIEAGTLQLNISIFTPTELVVGVQGVMEVMAQAKDLQLTTHVADDVPANLAGDWQRLHQILINLINNAIKFTEEGSVDTRIYVPDADHWALEVSDTGCGIPEEALSYIFDPFRQVDDSDTREYGGAGLGLSIVKQLVELMEGEIKLESEVDQGSTFTIVLPLVLNVPKEAKGNEFVELA